MNLFGIEKISVGECQELTIQSLHAHAYKHNHWAIAWSGGKDSTATLSLILYLIMSGQIERPKTLSVFYADTRMELPPLAISAQRMLKSLKELSKEMDWLSVHTVMAPLDKRFFVYILGRGVPPPNNNTLRWCTRQLKIDPMQEALKEKSIEHGEKILTITGVRLGESAIRDGRISMSCTKNGAECGQGWYQNTLSEKYTASLAPIIHWRVCNVWDWLMYFAPHKKYGAWDTVMLAQAYGGDQARENNARTGCVGCPLANRDSALDGVLKKFPEEWGYLAPLKKLRPIYREMRRKPHRVRKVGERNSDGKLSSSPNRIGPLTMEARMDFFQQILNVQEEINHAARATGKLEIDFLNLEEQARIQWHWKNNVWPQRWTGEEPIATEMHEQQFTDGSVQKLLFS
ncbi:MAG: phosphoadenosine phosphosulfate reductase family protein [Bacteroidota bacterium]